MRESAIRNRIGGGAMGRRPAEMSALALVLACAMTLLDGCTRNEDKPLPADSKARADFVEAQAAKMTEENRRLLQRFMLRVKAQEAAGGPAPTVTVTKALELQRAYDADVIQVQKRLQEHTAAAKSALRVEVREQALVNDAKSPSGKALRYVLDMTNVSKVGIDRAVLRVDFRDSSGKYLASVPGLDLKGPLKPAEAGRTVQLMPLNATYQAGILEGKLATIVATPTQIVYSNGDKLDSDVDLKALDSLARLRIP